MPVKRKLTVEDRLSALEAAVLKLQKELDDAKKTAMDLSEDLSYTQNRIDQRFR